MFCVFIGFTQEPNADVLIENKTVYCTSQALSRWKGAAPLSIWYLSMEGGRPLIPLVPTQLENELVKNRLFKLIFPVRIVVFMQFFFKKDRKFYTKIKFPRKFLIPVNLGCFFKAPIPAPSSSC